MRGRNGIRASVSRWLNAAESCAHSTSEVIDLTDSRATRLLYSWVQSGVRLKDAHVDLIPHIRIARENATGIVQSRPGRLDKMGLDGEMPKGEELDIDE